MASPGGLKDMFRRKAPSIFPWAKPAPPDQGQNPLLDHETYKHVRRLGSGSFGFVEMAVHQPSGDKVAIKFWPRGSAINASVRRELCNHSKFRHPNIIGFREVLLTNTHVGLVMELAAGGDLHKRVRQMKGLTEPEARRILQQLLFAIDYCHRLGVVNRDIKLENVLRSAPGSDYTIKLTDFGFCKSDQDSIPKTICGTPGYMAPEVVSARMGQPYCGKKADIWSCGVMLYIMVYGAYPPQIVQQSGFQAPAKPATSPEVRDLLKKMLRPDASQRLTLAEVCRHAWMASTVPPGFLDQNVALVAETMQAPPKQLEADIDAILLKAGLSEERILASPGATLQVASSR